MATTKFSMIYVNEETKNVLINELSGEYTYKMATAIAKELCGKQGDLLITVTESAKIFPNGEDKRVEKIDDTSLRICTKELKENSIG